MNGIEIMDLVAAQAGLGDAHTLRAKKKTTEYVRARAIAIRLMSKRNMGPHEIGRLLNRTPKSVRHSRDNWPYVWARDATALQIYAACQQILA